MCNSNIMYFFVYSILVCDMGAKTHLRFYFFLFFPILFTKMIQHKSIGQTKTQQSTQVTWSNYSWFMLCIDWCTDCMARSRGFPIHKSLFQEIDTDWFELVVLFQYKWKQNRKIEIRVVSLFNLGTSIEGTSKFCSYLQS